MKLHYYPETDSLYIELSVVSSSETRAISRTVNVDFDADGEVIGIDIDNASKRLDLEKLETLAPLLQSLRTA